jgi:hypothetical protein
VIVKYNQFFNLDNDTEVEIYLFIKKNKSFKKYIKNKYPKIIFNNLQNYDYYINCTIYGKHHDIINDSKNSNEKYISHEINKKLENNQNVFYLTDLAKNNVITADILPFAKKNLNYNKNNTLPTFIVQGSQKRRDISLLTKILENNYKYPYIIKILGRGNLSNKLKKYKDIIIFKKNLNFQNYHKEFLNSYCILPLITKKSHPQYYKKKLTSTINYAKGYNLKCIIDKDLQNIYNLENAIIFENENDIVSVFEKTLHDYYLE